LLELFLSGYLNNAAIPLGNAAIARTIIAFSVALDATGEYVFPPGIVPFPRGFAFGHDGRLFLASGIL
jgi:hypothetical protein